MSDVCLCLSGSSLSCAHLKLSLTLTHLKRPLQHGTFAKGPGLFFVPLPEVIPMRKVLHLSLATINAVLWFSHMQSKHNAYGAQTCMYVYVCTVATMLYPISIRGAPLVLKVKPVFL